MFLTMNLASICSNEIQPAVEEFEYPDEFTIVFVVKLAELKFVFFSLREVEIFARAEFELFKSVLAAISNPKLIGFNCVKIEQIQSEYSESFLHEHAFKDRFYEIMLRIFFKVLSVKDSSASSKEHCLLPADSVLYYSLQSVTKADFIHSVMFAIVDFLWKEFTQIYRMWLDTHVFFVNSSSNICPSVASFVVEQLKIYLKNWLNELLQKDSTLSFNPENILESNSHDICRLELSLSKQLEAAIANHENIDLLLQNAFFASKFAFLRLQRISQFSYVSSISDIITFFETFFKSHLNNEQSLCEELVEENILISVSSSEFFVFRLEYFARRLKFLMKPTRTLFDEMREVERAENNFLHLLSNEEWIMFDKFNLNTIILLEETAQKCETVDSCIFDVISNSRTILGGGVSFIVFKTFVIELYSGLGTFDIVSLNAALSVFCIIHKPINARGFMQPHSTRFPKRIDDPLCEQREITGDFFFSYIAELGFTFSHIIKSNFSHIHNMYFWSGLSFNEEFAFLCFNHSDGFVFTEECILVKTTNIEICRAALEFYEQNSEKFSLKFFAQASSDSLGLLIKKVTAKQSSFTDLSRPLHVIFQSSEYEIHIASKFIEIKASEYDPSLLSHMCAYVQDYSIVKFSYFRNSPSTNTARSDRMIQAAKKPARVGDCPTQI